MKVVLELKKEPQKNDLLIYDGECFTTISKDEVVKAIFTFKQEIADMEQEIKDFKVGVNDKLKTYHNILQVLTKEE